MKCESEQHSVLSIPVSYPPNLANTYTFFHSPHLPNKRNAPPQQAHINSQHSISEEKLWFSCFIVGDGRREEESNTSRDCDMSVILPTSRIDDLILIPPYEVGDIIPIL